MGFYDAADREQGGISNTDRQGCLRRFPILSLSLSVVPVRNARFRTHHEVSAVIAEIKHCAKAEADNTLFVDRRSD